MTDRTHPDSGRIITSSDVIADLQDRIAELESELEAVGAGGVNGPLMGKPQAMPDLSQLTAREALRTIGDEQAFEAWFKMDCPVEGANAKIAATAAWKARASLSANAGEPTEGAFQRALSIRAAQGWKLGGDKVPVLYTDEINGEQVCRDDLWLCTTAALAAPPTAQAEGWRLVPVDPTPAMAKAAADAWLDCGSRLVLNKAAAAVAAGIAAAPNHPTAEGVEHG